MPASAAGPRGVGGVDRARLPPWLAGAALAIWALIPLVWVYARYLPDRSPTGAASGTPVDELQYMAWIADAGRHWLSSSLWGIASLHHDFLHPMYTPSGVLVRLGASVQLAYLIWKPVAVVVLVAGFWAYVRRRVTGGARRVAALLLALFYVTPVAALLEWGNVGAPSRKFELALPVNNLFPAGTTWGQHHAAVAFGLSAAFVIGLERLLAGRGRPPVALLAGVGAAGVVVAWLRPWQGATLILIVLGVAAWRRERRWLGTLAALCAATALPLVYYYLLGRLDPAWRAANALIGREFPRPWALAAALLPIAAFAAAGVSRARLRDDGERILVLWPVAAAVVLLASPTHVMHAAGGVTLPLAVLAVRGWSRMRLPALVSGLALAVVTLPGMVARLDAYGGSIGGWLLRDQYAIADDDAALLRALDARPGDAGVLAPPGLGLSVPARTGRRSWTGHPAWTPRGRDVAAGLWFAGLELPRPGELRDTGAGYIVAGCGTGPAALARFRLVARRVASRGCAALYEVREPSRR